SGAYFGDKMSPLSDTTVIAASSGGVDLFEHIRYMMLTSGPAMLISLGVFITAGFFTDTQAGGNSAGDIVAGLERTFELSPWVLLIPAVTGILIAFRIPTLYTLAASSLLGLTGIFVFQPQVVEMLGATGGSVLSYIEMISNVLLSETQLSTGNQALDALVGTGGVAGMLPTIFLVVCAMIFGGVMMGTGMLQSISEAFTRMIRSRSGLVGTTAASGIMLNACTADQYLSIIVGSNMYKPVYQKFNLEPRLLSRTVEDSTSVTSVLIPWNSCGVTQSTVLGVATLVYLPYCVFNYLSPVMSMVMALTGWRIRSIKPARHVLAEG
ncbi:MAG: sodium:proton antiporter, partial [Muribaculaceae bacterium]|nr:sodium:proton antiporter [Muribaculaceae bacterium]